jgi:CRISPR/Cas system-associated protein Csm6
MLFRQLILYQIRVDPTFMVAASRTAGIKPASTRTILSALVLFALTLYIHKITKGLCICPYGAIHPSSFLIHPCHLLGDCTKRGIEVCPK